MGHGWECFGGVPRCPKGSKDPEGPRWGTEWSGEAQWMPEGSRVGKKGQERPERIFQRGPDTKFQEKGTCYSVFISSCD